MKRTIWLLYIFLASVCSLTAQPRLTSNKEIHHFGQVEWKRPVTVEYAITNTGNEPLVLTQVTTSCGCAVASWTKTPIAPGEQGTVSATFDAKALGRFDKSVAIYSNSFPSLVYLRFTGEVVQEISDYSQLYEHAIGQILIDKANLEFPDSHWGEDPQLVLHVVNTSDRPYEPTLMHLPHYVKMEKEPEVLLKGRRGIIRLTLDTKRLPDYGLTQTSVYLARFAGDKVNEENELPLSAVMLPDFSGMSETERAHAPKVHISEMEIDLSSQLARRNRAVHEVFLVNDGQSPLQVNRLQVFNNAIELRLKKATLQPGEVTTLQVVVQKKSLHKSRKPLRFLIITNDPVRPKVEVNIISGKL